MDSRGSNTDLAWSDPQIYITSIFARNLYLCESASDVVGKKNDPMLF